MARIKIQDLPRDMKISPDELRKVRGGTFSLSTTPYGVAPLGSGGVLPSIYTGPTGSIPIPIPSPYGRLFARK